jgi:hypothetical protein
MQRRQARTAHSAPACVAGRHPSTTLRSGGARGFVMLAIQDERDRPFRHCAVAIGMSKVAQRGFTIGRDTQTNFAKR